MSTAVDNIYNNILNSTSMTNTEKVNTLIAVHKEINKINDEDFKEAYKKFKYCPQCKEYYLTSQWIKNCITQKTSRRKYPCDPENFDYEEYIGLFLASICPKGHSKIENEI